MNIIVEKDDKYLISFDWNKRISQAVIKLPGVEYNDKYRRWECPRSYTNAVFLFGAKHGFQLPEKKSVRSVFGESTKELPELKTDIDLNLKMNLYDYQKKGAAYIIENGSAIIGDQPGLGKTAQAIAAVIAKNLFPCLVICPASLKYNWQAEWQLWTDKHNAAIMTDTIKHTWNVFYQMGLHDVFICNYESLRKYFVLKVEKPKGARFTIKDIRFHPNINLFKSVIIDESHRVKEPATMQSKLAYGITRGKELKLLLSGTPVVNKPVDLLSQLLIIDKIDKFGGVKNFREMCADDERWPEINYILRENCYFRREKKTVLTELPDKRRQKIYCEINNRDEYNAALSDLERYLREYRDATESQIQKSMRAKIVAQINVLRNITARGKISAAIEYINDLIESGEKTVVFIYLHEVAGELKNAFPEALFFTGAQNTDERNRAVHEFQRCKECDVRFERHGDAGHDFVPTENKIIFVNYKAGGVGITLTASSNILFIELPWHSADTDQAEDRCHRISQKNAVNVAYLIGKNTIDESVLEKIEYKREMTEACTGAKDDTEEETVNFAKRLIQRKA